MKNRGMIFLVRLIFILLVSQKARVICVALVVKFLLHLESKFETEK